MLVLHLRLELDLEIPAAALTWPRVRIDAGGFQVGVTQGGRHQCNGAGHRKAQHLRTRARCFLDWVQLGRRAIT